ncbi:hypothetical protein K0U07_02310 [bacterium]|nr:hypothetical protein [bacterium]
MAVTRNDVPSPAAVVNGPARLERSPTDRAVEVLPHVRVDKGDQMVTLARRHARLAAVAISTDVVGGKSLHQRVSAEKKDLFRFVMPGGAKAKSKTKQRVEQCWIRCVVADLRAIRVVEVKHVALGALEEAYVGVVKAGEVECLYRKIKEAGTGAIVNLADARDRIAKQAQELQQRVAHEARVAAREARWQKEEEAMDSAIEELNRRILGTILRRFKPIFDDHFSHWKMPGNERYVQVVQLLRPAEYRKYFAVDHVEALRDNADAIAKKYRITGRPVQFLCQQDVVFVVHHCINFFYDEEPSARQSVWSKSTKKSVKQRRRDVKNRLMQFVFSKPESRGVLLMTDSIASKYGLE